MIRTQWSGIPDNLTYFDSAATTLLPDSVVDGMAEFAKKNYATVHRAGYRRAELATTTFESARAKIADWFDVDTQHVIINRGCTDGLNAVLASLAQQWQSGDNVITSIFDHHSSFVPLQQWAKKQQCTLHVVNSTEQHEFDYDHFASLVTEKTKCVCITHLSNVTGTVIDIQKIHTILKKKGVRDNVTLVVDGAQSAVHVHPSFPTLGADIYVVSAHKMYGPTGVGATIINQRMAETLQPSRFGGQMINNVTQDESTWTDGVQRFEPGTPPTIELVGWAHAIDFLHEHKDKTNTATILEQAKQTVQQHATVLCAPQPVGCFSFIMPDAHAHDVAALCDDKNVCVRAGHCCAQPLMQTFGVPAVVRVSVGIHNNEKDIEQLAVALLHAKKVLRC